MAKKINTKQAPWIDTIRRESGLIEHVCKHGVGHPAYGSVHWMELNGQEKMGVHGCDGCCLTPEWQAAEAREGVCKANELLFNTLKPVKPLKAQVTKLRRKYERRTPTKAV